jgi:hypothetical protein
VRGGAVHKVTVREGGRSALHSQGTENEQGADEVVDLLLEALVAVDP